MKKITLLFFTLLLSVTSWRVSGQYFTEGFEGTFPSPWTHTQFNPVKTWGFSTMSAHTGTQSLQCDYDDTYTSDQNELMISPVIDLSTATSPEVTFWFLMSYYWGVDPNNNYDLKVEGTTDGGATSTVLWTESDQGVFVNWTWYEVTVPLSAFVGQANFQLILRYEGYDGAQGNFDDIVVAEAPTCLEPTGLTASGFTTTSANLGWTAGGTESSWNIEYGVFGFSPSGTPTNTGVSNPFNLTGLSAATTYQYYVQADCGGSAGSSEWVGPFTFTTLCDAQNVPYSIDFESVTTPALPVCTVNVNDGAGNNWTTVAAPGYGFTTQTLRYSFNSANSADTWFFTNGLNLVGGTSYRVEFDYGNNSSSFTESLMATYGTSQTSGGVLDVIVDYPTIEDATIHHAIADFTPSTTGVYYLGFYAYSAPDQWNLFLDNIYVDVTPACPAPTSFELDSADATSATFSWTNGGAETEWELEWGPTGFTQGTGTVETITAVSPYTLTGLSYGVTYDAYLRAKCSATEQSNWTSAVTWFYIDLAECVTVIYPTDGMIDVPVGDVDFSWNPSTTGEPATSYNMYYGLTPTTVTSFVGNFTDTTVAINLSGYNTTFYWMILPVNDAGETQGCSIWSFTTEAYVPPVCTVTEYFEETTVPTGWSTVINAGTCDFAFGSGDMPTGPDFVSGAAIFNDDACGEDGGVNNVSLLSPVYDLTGATSASLGFDVAFQDFAGSGEFSVEVYNGTAWVEIVNYNTTDLAAILSASFDVLSYANSAFQVRFTYDDEGDWAWGAGLDNFCLNTDAPGLGIANEIIDGFAMYPNPVENTLTLRALNAIDAVSVYNMLGQEVMKSIPSATQVQLDMTQLPVGTYVVKVQAGSQLGSYSLIKQ